MPAPVGAWSALIPDAGEIRFFILVDRAVPYLLARVRWPDVAQAITAGCPDWLDDVGLFDTPYDPSAVRVTFTQAASVAVGWGRQLREEPAGNAPSFIRRMPANWSDLTPGERRVFGVEHASWRRVSPRSLHRVRASQVTAGAPARSAVAANGHAGIGHPGFDDRGRHRTDAGAHAGTGAERRAQVRVRVDGRAHIRFGQSTLSAPLVDLSERGMRCVLPDASRLPAPGQDIGRPFLLEGEAGKSRICLAVPGRVSWLSHGRSSTHFGVTFGQLSDGEVDGLQRFLVTAGSRRGQ